MVLLDTNIFVIDRFFKRDERYEVNQKFIQNLADIEASFSIFSLIELCGIASFNLSGSELEKWLLRFERVYRIRILPPKTETLSFFEDWFAGFLDGLFKRIRRKMSYGDAVLLKEAEDYQVASIITWNKKHFESKTQIEVLTPAELLSRGKNRTMC